MDLYDKINSKLKEKGITKKRMCEDLEISYNTLMSMFSRKSKNLDLETIQSITDYLGITLDTLIRNSASEDNSEIEPEAQKEKSFTLDSEHALRLDVLSEKSQGILTELYGHLLTLEKERAETGQQPLPKETYEPKVLAAHKTDSKETDEVKTKIEEVRQRAARKASGKERE